jgi:hypothetical protein
MGPRNAQVAASRGADVRGEVIPLRPLTLAEILDAAVELFRRNASGLLVVSVVLAVVEQALLFPLRTLAVVSPPWYEPRLGHLGSYWLLLAAGFGTELAIIALLGGLAARAAVPALAESAVVPTLADGAAPVVTPAPRWLAGRGARLGGLSVLAVLVAAGGALTAAAGLLPWIGWYVFTGLAAPAMTTERRGPLSAFGRSISLVARSGLRPGFIRLLGYFAWWLIRLALAAGGLAALQLTGQLTTGIWLRLAGVAAWIMVNTAAYAVLGCLDAVLHLEARMRTEGLDLALDRALRRGIPAEQIVAVRR